MYIQKKVLTEIFAPIIWASVEQYIGIEKNKKLDENEKPILRQKIKKTINETLRYWEEEQEKMVSQGAKILANNYNVKNKTKHDITRLKYTNRKIFNGPTGKPNIMFDHTTPVNLTVEIIITSISLNDVENKLNDTSPVCLITRKEDDILNTNGFKNKRPEGWVGCYDQCGIKI